MNSQITAANARTIDVGGDLTVSRLGFGAMRITGPGIWGDPPDRDTARAALRRAVTRRSRSQTADGADQSRKATPSDDAPMRHGRKPGQGSQRGRR
jgi:hypothetical protein